MLVGLIAAGSPLPYTAVALIPLAWAGVESVLSIRARSHVGPGSAPVAALISSVVGLVLVFVLTVMVLTPYAFYDSQKHLQDCTLGANTAIAAADCKVRYGESESILGDVLSSG
jgi:hypothetical protein